MRLPWYRILFGLSALGLISLSGYCYTHKPGWWQRIQEHFTGQHYTLNAHNTPEKRVNWARNGDDSVEVFLVPNIQHDYETGAILIGTAAEDLLGEDDFGLVVTSLTSTPYRIRLEGWSRCGDDVLLMFECAGYPLPVLGVPGEVVAKQGFTIKSFTESDSFTKSPEVTIYDHVMKCEIVLTDVPTECDWCVTVQDTEGNEHVISQHYPEYENVDGHFRITEVDVRNGLICVERHCGMGRPVVKEFHLSSL